MASSVVHMQVTEGSSLGSLVYLVLDDSSGNGHYPGPVLRVCSIRLCGVVVMGCIAAAQSKVDKGLETLRSKSMMTLLDLLVFRKQTEARSLLVSPKSCLKIGTSQRNGFSKQDQHPP